MAAVNETIMDLGFEAVTAAAMKSTLIWDVTSSIMVQVFWRFEETYYFWIQRQRVILGNKPGVMYQKIALFMVVDVQLPEKAGNFFSK